MSLIDLEIKDTYSSSTRDNDLVLEFYNPVLGQAVQYDRITGFFSPAVLSVASRGFAGLISTKGKIRLITSVQLDEGIYNSIMEGSRKLGDSLIDDFDIASIKTELDRDYLSVFAWLYRSGQLEMKVAVTSRQSSMLHQKIGIVTDVEGNSISFSGSNNETPNGWQHNIEQFKVFKSWNPHTASFFESDKEEFEVLWNNMSNKASVIRVDDAIKDRLIQKIEKSRKDDINTVVKRIRNREHVNKMRIVSAKKSNDNLTDPSKNKSETSNSGAGQEVKQIVDSALEKTDNKPLRKYQKRAIEHWRDSGYRGVFEMATGTGKTVTAINGLKSLRSEKGSLHSVILVPLVTLAEQWKKDINNILGNVTVIAASSANSSWKNQFNNLINTRRLGIETDYIIITTYSNFSSSKFSDMMDSLPDNDIVIVADEMHNVVTESNLKKLDNDRFLYRLGLSATPTRLWKPDESSEAIELFGSATFRYGLEKAIENGYLVPYTYHIHRAYLTEEEYSEYVLLSKDISKLSHIDNGKNSSYQYKLIQRARLKKQAENKLVALENLIEKYRKNNRLKDTLIYVDSEAHLSEVQKLLTRQHVKTTKFTGTETLEQRLSTINNLRTHKIDAIVAIKCLDEGVDIPSAKAAFFLSNNTDPREYVQRLGRVLRLDPSGGKNVAEVHDFIILPPMGAHLERSDISRNLVTNEFKRAFFFKKLCNNIIDVDIELGSIMDDYGYYITEEELEDTQKEVG